MLRSILVPLDGSDFAEHALPLAAGLARRANAVLHLAHVHLPVVGGTPAGMALLPISDLRHREDEQVYLADVGRRLRQHAPVQLETSLLEGSVSEALKEYAEQRSIDLVVIATHARGALGRFWLGSVADDLGTELRCPILLTHSGEGKADLSRTMELRSIVVPLDGTPEAERGAKPAVELARLFDAELNLVRVNPPALLSAYVPEGGVGVGYAIDEADEVERREMEEAKRYLAGMAAKLAAEGIRVRTDVLLDERPEGGIMAEAAARHADLIAMETHARRGLARLLMGSVAERVIRESETPVLLHHGEE